MGRITVGLEVEGCRKFWVNDYMSQRAKGGWAQWVKVRKKLKIEEVAENTRLVQHVCECSVWLFLT